MNKKPIIINAAPSSRALRSKPDTLNEEDRTIEVVFASESPCESWLPELGRYQEILDCTEKSCDMTRLNSGAQFLKEHDRSLVVGVVEAAHFADRLGIAKLRFAKNALGEEEFQLAKDGIRRNYSVSYTVRELTLEKVSEEDGDIYRATGWQPLEISVVSVEADINCKALRSRAEGVTPVTIQISQENQSMKKSLINRFYLEQENGGGSGSPAAPAIDIEAERIKLRKEERAALVRGQQEINESVEAFKRAGCDVSELAKKALGEDWTVDRFRAEAVKLIGAQNASAIVLPSQIDRTPPSRSVGQLFTEAEQVRGFKNGSGKRSVAVNIPEHTNFRATGLTSTITNYSGITQAPGPITLGVQRPSIAMLMSEGVTSLSSVPYLLEDTLTPAATSVAEEGSKPEASWDWSQTSAPVIKVAVIGRVSDELFEDVPGMQSYIDSRLRYMVEIEEDDQLLNGNGSPDMTGIINTSGVSTQAKGGDTVPDCIRKGITKVESTGFFAPDAIVMHPNDWEAIQLLKDSAGQYLAGGPVYLPYGNGIFVRVSTLWGLPVIVTSSCPENTAIVGAWKLGAMIFRKKGLTLESTNSDASDFKYNRIAIRAEQRAALAVWRPKAFCLCTGI